MIALGDVIGYISQLVYGRYIRAHCAEAALQFLFILWEVGGMGKNE